MQILQDESFEFSGGKRRLGGLKYVIFGLGNKTYEHYNSIGRAVDAELTKLGAVRIGERGEGDDDKSMEEDYLEWKDSMWDAFATALNVEEGQGGDSADFAVSELDSHPSEKVYLGRALSPTLITTISLTLMLRRTFGACTHEDQGYPRCQESLPIPHQWFPGAFPSYR
jgi:NADPH-ferrihemoprotein reductase